MECSRCYKRIPRPGQRMCDICQSRMRKQYHKLRREKELGRFDWMTELKTSMKCADCQKPFRSPKEAAWDHRPGEVKVANISDMIKSGASQEEVLVECAKCDLVCPRCHALRGIARGQIKTGPQSVAICQYCNTEFRVRASRNQRFCSRSCGQKNRWANLTIIWWEPPKKPKPLSQRQQWLRSLDV